MRELTKAINSYSWVSTLYPVQLLFQMATVRDVSKTSERMTNSLNEVTVATANQLDGVVKSIYDTGETLQKELVNSTFALFSAENLNLKSLTETTSNVFDASMDFVKSWMPGLESGGKKTEKGAAKASEKAS